MAVRLGVALLESGDKAGFGAFRLAGPASPISQREENCCSTLETPDRDVRKPHENPAIGVLLSASKGDEVWSAR